VRDRPGAFAEQTSNLEVAHRPAPAGARVPAQESEHRDLSPIATFFQRRDLDLQRRLEREQQDPGLLGQGVHRRPLAEDSDALLRGADKETHATLDERNCWLEIQPDVSECVQLWMLGI